MLKNIVVNQGGVWDNFVKWIDKNF
jgi:hypothetical protein